MSEEQKSFPVRYMVICDEGGFWIADTLVAGVRAVCEGMNHSFAHHICKLLNEAEGYRYGNT